MKVAIYCRVSQDTLTYEKTKKARAKEIEIINRLRERRKNEIRD